MSRTFIVRTLWASLIAAALPALAMAQAAGTSGTYIATASGNWSTTASWTLTGGDPYPDAGGVASFAGGQFAVGSNGYITAATTVTIDAGVTQPLQLSGINFNNVANGFAYTIAAAGSNAITFVDSGAGATLSITAANNLATNTISAPVVLNTNLNVTSVTNALAVSQISGAITGTFGINVNLSSAHDEAGYFVLSSTTSTFSGGVTLNSGSLQVSGAATGSPGAVTAGPLGTGTLTINGGQLLTGTTTIANSILANATLVFAGGSGAETISSVISGAGGLTNRSRGSTLSLTNADTYMGATLVQNEPVPLVNTNPAVGTIALNGASGSALNSSSFTAQGGGTILLDNSGVATAIARIGSTAGVTVQNGTFRINGSTATTGSFTQNAGTLTSNGGFGTVIVAPVAVGDQGVVMNFASLSRGTGNGTFLFNGGTSLGGAAPGLGVSQITFNTPPTLVGGSLTAGQPNLAIIPYAIGSAAAAGTGTDLVTYDTNGVRLLTASEYASNTTTALTAGQNVKITSSSPTITNNSNISIQSLLLSTPTTAGATLGGSGTLTVTSGTIVSVDPTTATATTNVINNPLNFGSAEGVLIQTNGLTDNLQINGVISGTGGLTKSGTGVTILQLGSAGPTTSNVFGNTYTGPTTLAGGFFVINDARVFGPDTSTIQVWAAGGGNNTAITNTTTGLVVNLNRNININDGFASLNGNQNHTAMLMTGTLSGPGALYIADAGTGGITFLSGANTITGEIRLDSGNLAVASDANLGNAAAVDLGTNITSTNPPLGLKLFGNLTTSKLFNISSSSTIDTGSFNAVLNGPITDQGSETIAKFGTGTLQFTNATNGMTGLIIDNGTVLVSGAAQLTNTSLVGMAINSGKLQLDYTANPTVAKLSTANNVLFGSNGPGGIANGGGGTLELDAGNNVGVTQQVTTITVPLASSATTAASVASIILNAGASGSTGGTGSVTLQATNLNYSNSTNPANSMMFVAGDGLGTTTKLLVSNFQLAGSGSGSASALIGGVYASNVGQPSLGIIRGGYGDITATGTGSGLLTYDSSTGGGFRLLAASEYQNNSTAQYSGTGTSTNANVLVNTATTTSTASDTINSLFVTGGNTLATTGTLTIVSGTILSTGGSNVINGTGTGGGGGTLSGTTAGAISGFNFAVPSNLLVNTQLLGGAGQLIKMGPGTLTFDPLSAAGASVNTSTFTGGVNIAGGTLQVTDTTVTSLSVLSSGSFYLSNGATFRYEGSGATATTRVVNLNGSGGTIDLPGTFWQISNAGTGNLIIGSGALTLTNGSLIIGANSTTANTYQGGTNLNGGTLLINASSSNTLGTGVLNLNGGQLGVRSASRTISANEVVVNASTTFVNDFVVTGPNGSALTADTSSGSGLTISAPSRLEASVTLTNSMIQSGLVTFSGSIYDDPFIAPSQLTLASGASAGGFLFSIANAYRGSTVLSSGILNVTNTYASGTGTGTVAVNGGTLKGTGYILPTQGSEAANAVSINSGAVISPGNSLGTLTIGSPVTPGTTTATVNENAGAIFNFLYSSGHVASAALDTGGSATPGGATGNNFLQIYGTLNINALADFEISSATLSDFNNTLTYSFQLANASNGNGGSPYYINSVYNPGQFLGAGALALENDGFVLEVGNSLNGSNAEYFNMYPAVPEPGSMLLLGSAALGGLGWYRRRRQARQA